MTVNRCRPAGFYFMPELMPSAGLANVGDVFAEQTFCSVRELDAYDKLYREHSVLMKKWAR